jgi:hypothetical protein
MEPRISELNSDFITLINHRETTSRIFENLSNRIKKLKTIYDDLIVNNQKQVFIFGLDSFRFQSKLIDIESDEMKRMFLAINNRMYCEYYKLYRMIICYISETINDIKINDNMKISVFPVYRDLEPFKEYDFTVITELHNNILLLLTEVIHYINAKDRELVSHNKKMNSGLNIDNFVSSFDHELNNMRDKIKLFINYITFFHKTHIKMLKRFCNKLQIMYSQIDTDIKFDEGIVADNEIDIVLSSVSPITYEDSNLAHYADIQDNIDKDEYEDTLHDNTLDNNIKLSITSVNDSANTIKKRKKKKK